MEQQKNEESETEKSTETADSTETTKPAEEASPVEKATAPKGNSPARKSKSPKRKSNIRPAVLPAAAGEESTNVGESEEGINYSDHTLLVRKFLSNLCSSLLITNVIAI